MRASRFVARRYDFRWTLLRHHGARAGADCTRRVCAGSIQSERAFVFTHRSELDQALGPPRKLDEIRLPGAPLRRKLVPIAEVLRRRSECEVHLVEGSWQPAVVQNREFGPVRIGSAAFAGRKANGAWRPGAKIRTENSKQVWRVMAMFGDGHVQVRSGMNKHVVKSETVVAEEKFAVQVYFVDGQAFRVAASEVAEPPLYQYKACYWESRCSPGFYRILLDKEGWGAMEKDAQQLRLWEQRAAEEVGQPAPQAASKVSHEARRSSQLRGVRGVARSAPSQLRIATIRHGLKMFVLILPCFGHFG